MAQAARPPASGAGHALLLAWLAAMAFLFHVPHTIALRNVLLVIGIVVVVAGWRRSPRPSLPEALRASAWALLALTVWMALQAMLFSPTTWHALGRLRADWLMHFVGGVTAAFIAVRVRPSNALRPVIIAMTVAVALVLAHQARAWLATGIWPLGPWGLTPYAEHDFQSTVHGLLAALVIADHASLSICQKSPIALGTLPGWLLCAFVLATDVVMHARNGTAVIIALLVVAIGLVVWLRVRRSYQLSFLVAGALAVGAMVYVSLHSDKRWSGFGESYVIGWTSESRCWQNFSSANCPITPSGKPLEESAYMRAAWTREAVGAIADRPLGYGFGHDAFGRAVQERHGIVGWGSSHSGWLDFALGVGVPGLVLLILTGALAVRGGWRQFRIKNDGAGLLFSFFVGGYLLRCLLDGHLSGWRLGMFTFICGVIIATMQPREGSQAEGSQADSGLLR